MSGSHSSTVAEERLFASAKDHQGTTTFLTKTISKDDPNAPLLTATIIGDGPGKVDPVSAFEVSARTRILQIAVAVTYCLFAAGIVFGYAALKPVLIAEDIYREYCTREEEDEGVRVCYQQELRLNFMFTVAAVATNVCALLVGTILDQWGPRVAGVIGSWLLAFGLTGFGFAKQIKFIDPYPISYLLIALGGPFIFIPSFHLANAFPRRSGLILSLLTGAFDASSIVFLVYRVLYQRSSSISLPDSDEDTSFFSAVFRSAEKEPSGGLSLHTFFLSYLVVPVFIFLAQIFIMPAQSYKTASELTQQAVVERDLLDHENEFLSPSESSSLRRQTRERRESVISEVEGLLGAPIPEAQENTEQKHHISGVWGVMHNASVSQQLSSFWFWGIALFTIIQMTRINYFVATIRPQYEYLLGNYEDSVAINGFFDIALPIGGLLAIPFIGVVLDCLPTITVLSVLVTVATTIGVLGLIPNSYIAAYANIMLFCAYRPFYYTVVSDYCAKVFGVKTFGKIYGSVICMAGMFNLTQAGLDAIVFKLCDGDPRLVNAGLLGVAVVVGIALVAFVGKQAKGERRRLLSEEAERYCGVGDSGSGERDRLVGGETGYGAV